MEGLEEIGENLFKADPKALDRVIESGEPVFVDFYADWCAPCKMVSPRVESVARDYTGRMRFVKADVDQARDAAIRYGIHAVPTLMMFKDGEPQERLLGAVGEEEIREAIEEVLG